MNTKIVATSFEISLSYQERNYVITPSQYPINSIIRGFIRILNLNTNNDCRSFFRTITNLFFARKVYNESLYSLNTKAET